MLLSHAPHPSMCLGPWLWLMAGSMSQMLLEDPGHFACCRQAKPACEQSTQCMVYLIIYVCCCSYMTMFRQFSVQVTV